MANSTLRKKNTRNTGKPMITKPSMGPREASIQFILGYSRALRVVDAPPIGQVDIILN
ncbi:MAG: hypothetical protein KBA60_05445 [Flavobacteriales bacterium]|nr:hypothetical protein [Flavobacteriales bacterium]MBP6641722.1 hypothetical protein [Flavobacteriales bacterium]MBP7155430.1 hypothetical protein [Flavobacteriales bacterium]HQV75034.1 hypothetical protein [Flavobacteriales bacterium]HQW40665.1 hypothetical protein [Flavobacteriales bacterium]